MILKYGSLALILSRFKWLADMSDLKNADITSLPNVRKPTQFETISLLRALGHIKQGQYKEAIKAVRFDMLIGDDEGYKAKKGNLPAYCFHGMFESKVANDNFIRSSGIFLVDLDNLTSEQMIAFRHLFIDCPYTVFIFTSPSEWGLKAGFRVNPSLITGDKSFKVAYSQIEAFLAKQGITIDKACKDVRRLSYVSDDPELYLNENAVEFPLVDVADNALQAKKPLASKPITVLPTLVDNESECIARCVSTLEKAQPGNRHGDGRLKAGMLAGGYIAGGQVNEEKITDILIQVSDNISDNGETSESERKTLLDAIKKGKETPISPKLDWEIELEAHVEKMNETHASVVIGGKHKVMRWTIATLDGRAVYEFYSRKELSLLHDNTHIKIGEKTLTRRIQDIYSNELMAWAKHPMARTYTAGVVFLPGREAPDNCFNTWTGFSVEPIQNIGLLAGIHYHLKEVVCAGKAELYEYLLKWIAYTIQNPDKPAGAAIVLRGLKGCGKGTLGHFLRAIWGIHGLHISNPKHLVGNFNSHLADICFLFADEAFYSGDKQHESVLKTLITEPTVIIERKGIDAVSQPNFLKILMATNAEFAVPASRDERRYCVFDVSSFHIGNTTYFNTLHADCKSQEVQAAFLFEMLNTDLTGWHTGDIPDSEGLRAQRYHSMDSLQKLIVDSLLNGSFGVCCEGIEYGDEWKLEMSSNDLFSNYMIHCKPAKTVSVQPRHIPKD